MSYIRDLRNLVGHAPILMPSACVLVINEHNQILLERRRDNNIWGYPGGCVELFEDVEDTARREVLEETGIKCGGLDLFALKSGQSRHYFYPNGDEVCIIEAVYVCREFTGELKAQENEVEELGFFDYSAMPEGISPMNLDVIDEYYRKFPNS